MELSHAAKGRELYVDKGSGGRGGRGEIKGREGGRKDGLVRMEGVGGDVRHEREGEKRVRKRDRRERMECMRGVNAEEPEGGTEREGGRGEEMRKVEAVWKEVRVRGREESGVR